MCFFLRICSLPLVLALSLSSRVVDNMLVVSVRWGNPRLITGIPRIISQTCSVSRMSRRCCSGVILRDHAGSLHLQQSVRGIDQAHQTGTTPLFFSFFLHSCFLTEIIFTPGLNSTLSISCLRVCQIGVDCKSAVKSGAYFARHGGFVFLKSFMLMMGANTLILAESASAGFEKMHFMKD